MGRGLNPRAEGCPSRQSQGLQRQKSYKAGPGWNAPPYRLLRDPKSHQTRPCTGAGAVGALGGQGLRSVTWAEVPHTVGAWESQSAAEAEHQNKK